MTEASFSPINSLEKTLRDAQEGRASPEAFTSELLASQIFLLIDREIGAEGRWDSSINMCVLTNPAGEPVVAAFTAPERSTPWSQRLPEFAYGLLVNFTWLLQGLSPSVGIVLNPGHPVGAELAPEALDRFRQRVAAREAAT